MRLAVGAAARAFAVLAVVLAAGAAAQIPMPEYNPLTTWKLNLQQRSLTIRLTASTPLQKEALQNAYRVDFFLLDNGAAVLNDDPLSGGNMLMPGSNPERSWMRCQAATADSPTANCFFKKVVDTVTDSAGVETKVHALVLTLLQLPDDLASWIFHPQNTRSTGLAAATRDALYLAMRCPPSPSPGTDHDFLVIYKDTASSGEGLQYSWPTNGGKDAEALTLNPCQHMPLLPNPTTFGWVPYVLEVERGCPSYAKYEPPMYDSRSAPAFHAIYQVYCTSMSCLQGAQTCADTPVDVEGRACVCADSGGDPGAMREAAQMAEKRLTYMVDGPIDDPTKLSALRNRVFVRAQNPDQGLEFSGPMRDVEFAGVLKTVGALLANTITFANFENLHAMPSLKASSLGVFVDWFPLLMPPERPATSVTLVVRNNSKLSDLGVLAARVISNPSQHRLIVENNVQPCLGNSIGVCTLLASRSKISYQHRPNCAHACPFDMVGDVCTSSSPHNSDFCESPAGFSSSKDLESFRNRSCSTICGNLVLDAMPNFSSRDLQATFESVTQISGDLRVTNNGDLLSLDFLSNLRTVGGAVFVDNNARLASTALELHMSTNSVPGLGVPIAVSKFSNPRLCSVNYPRVFVPKIECNGGVVRLAGVAGFGGYCPASSPIIYKDGDTQKMLGADDVCKNGGSGSIVPTADALLEVWCGRRADEVCASVVLDQSVSFSNVSFCEFKEREKALTDKWRRYYLNLGATFSYKGARRGAGTTDNCPSSGAAKTSSSSSPSSDSKPAPSRRRRAGTAGDTFTVVFTVSFDSSNYTITRTLTLDNNTSLEELALEVFPGLGQFAVVTVESVDNTDPFNLVVDSRSSGMFMTWTPPSNSTQHSALYRESTPQDTFDKIATLIGKEFFDPERLGTDLTVQSMTSKAVDAARPWTIVATDSPLAPDSNGEVSVLVTGLKPSTSYEFRAVAFSGGSTFVSLDVTENTAKKSLKLLGMRTTAADSESFTIAWDFPAVPPGVAIVGYQVQISHYGQEFDAGWRSAGLTGPTDSLTRVLAMGGTNGTSVTSTTVVSGALASNSSITYTVKPWTTYLAEVRALSADDHHGPWSSVQLQTDEGQAQPPHKITATVLGGNREGLVLLRFEAPSPQHGHIVKYELHWDPPTSSGASSLVINDARTFSQQDADLAAGKPYVVEGTVEMGLERGKNYSLRLRTVGSGGSSVLSDPVFAYSGSTVASSSSSSGTPMAVVGSLVGVGAVALVVLILLAVFVRQGKKPNNLPPLDKDWEYPRKKLLMGNDLGSGQFGTVKQATAKGGIRETNADTIVAVKACTLGVGGEEPTAEDERAFLAEAELMKRVSTFDNYNPNVLRLLGLCTRQAPLLIIVEYMKNGDLKGFLKKNRPAPNKQCGVSCYLLCRMAADVANGVDYLSKMGCVHRDLACRNCLVSDKLVVKIADFGLSRDVHDTNDYYRKTGEALLPVRWLAPECLREGRYTVESDRWSFGVVMWEIFSLGQLPYPQLGNMAVFNGITQGMRMGRPVGTPDTAFRLMQKCWNTDPRERPEPKHLKRDLEDLADHEKATCGESAPFLDFNTYAKTYRAVDTVLRDAAGADADGFGFALEESESPRRESSDSAFSQSSSGRYKAMPGYMPSLPGTMERNETMASGGSVEGYVAFGARSGSETTIDVNGQAYVATSPTANGGHSTDYTPIEQMGNGHGRAGGAPDERSSAYIPTSAQVRSDATVYSPIPQGDLGFEEMELRPLPSAHGSIKEEYVPVNTGEAAAGNDAAARRALGLANGTGTGGRHKSILA